MCLHVQVIDLQSTSIYGVSNLYGADMQGGANGRIAKEGITAVAWNNKADHIIASSAGGDVTIWDLKQRKARQKLYDKNR